MKTKKSKLMQRVLGIVMALTVAVIPTCSSVSAADVDTTVSSTAQTRSLSMQGYYGSGVYYLGQKTFSNNYYTSNFTVGGSEMRIRLAFKKADGAASDVDVDVYSRRSVNLGGKYFHHRFCKMHDKDGKDGNGYYYVESGWQQVDSGQVYNIFLDACTAYYEAQPGYNRSADVHIWLEIR